MYVYTFAVYGQFVLVYSLAHFSLFVTQTHTRTISLFYIYYSLSLCLYYLYIFIHPSIFIYFPLNLLFLSLPL